MLQCFLYWFSALPPLLGGSLTLYSSLQAIFTLHLLIIQSTIWVLVPSNTFPNFLWVAATKAAQGSSSHKCGQEVWWDILNVVAAAIPLFTSRLTPSLKLFLYSVAPSRNMPLMWPWPASLTLPSVCMGSSKLYWPPQPWVWHMAWLPCQISIPHTFYSQKQVFENRKQKLLPNIT